MDILPQNQSNTGIFASFYIKPVEHKGRSREEGRPIFIEREYVKIHIAGDTKTEVNRPARDEDKQRFRPQYEAFLAQKETPVEGTPIDQWPQLGVTQVAELKGLHIHTVEALAELPDTGIKRLGMGGRELVKKAKAYLDAASGGAPMGALIEENEKLQSEVAMLKDQLKAMNDTIDELKQAKE